MLFCLVALVSAREFTISGFSSGAFMAHQMHVAYSSSIKGTAVISGGPLYVYPYGQKYMPEDSIIYAQEQEELGTIDKLENLKNSKAYIFNGSEDVRVPIVLGMMVQMFYEKMGANFTSNFEIPSGHGWVTEDYGIECSDDHWPYFNKCGFDTAKALLSWLYNPVSLKKTSQVPENLEKFDETEFFEETENGLASEGYFYLPTGCSLETCDLHLSLHGCGMNYVDVEDRFVTKTGLNEWAEGSNIIVIYPETTRNDVNPANCWDFEGFTGNDFANQNGVQMKFLYNLSQNFNI